MNNTITIVIIVCITIIVLYAISAVDRALQRKEVNKQINRFNKAFPDHAPKKLEKHDENLPKFGDE